jgi:hypothetical protein
MSFRGLEAAGTTGRLIALELKMLLRNKRPRAMTVFAGAMIPFLIGFEAYWLAQMPEREEIYPVPDPVTLQQAAAEEARVHAGPHQNRVTFSVRPRSVPERTWVHVTGNLSALGEWNPGAVPLIPQEDGSWRRTVLVPSDTLMECRVTLGSWDAQRLLADGSRPANTQLVVEHDTTLTIAADRWRHPEIFILITVNMIYIGILLSGMFLISYGQLLLGWDGSYLEGILARPVSLSRYVAAKYALLVGSVFVLSLLTLPLGLLKPWFLPANGALTLYNAGVNAPLLLMMAQFSRRPVDLNASLFSMQGKGSVQILLLAPVLLGPILVYACCALLGNAALTFWVLGALGLLGLVSYRPLLRQTVRMILQRKHRIVAAYRLV